MCVSGWTRFRRGRPDGYRTWQVLTDEGVVLQGSLRSRDANGITLVDSASKEIVIEQNSIVEQRQTTDSLMPSGLHAPLTMEQFSDLIAYMVSRKSDPRTESAQPLQEGFLPVSNSRDLIGWRVNDLHRLHWSVKDARSCQLLPPSGRARTEGVKSRIVSFRR